MRRILLSLFSLFFLFVFSGFSAAEINVMTAGAVSDGKTDNTKAFQKALDQAEKTGDTVFVPAGKYRFDGSLIIPENVTLKGSWEGPHLPEIEKGSTLLVYGGRDDEKAPAFITMKKNSILKGFTIHYPQQRGDNVHPYPWTIRKDGFRISVMDCAIANTFNGIDCGTIANAGTHLRNIDMCALRRGIYIDRSADIDRFENIHIHPVSYVSAGKDDPGPVEFMKKNLEGIIIGYCDWDYMTNCFVILAKVGFKFIETPLNPGEKREDTSDWYPSEVNTPNMLITQSGSDLGPLAVKIERTKEHAGIAFENCQFMSGIEIEEGNKGTVKFTNCGFWGQSGTGKVVANKGTGTVILNACHFSAWDDKRFKPNFRWDPKVPFVEFEKGTLHMSLCVFKDLGNIPDAHVYLGENVRSATVCQNSVEKGRFNVVNKSRGDVFINGNVGEKK